jgi:hypothetical protein
MGQYLTTEEFIRRAKRVHGEKFDYSKTIYVSQMTQGNINKKVYDAFINYKVEITD